MEGVARQAVEEALAVRFGAAVARAGAFHSLFTRGVLRGLMSALHHLDLHVKPFVPRDERVRVGGGHLCVLLHSEGKLGFLVVLVVVNKVRCLLLL